MTSYRFRFASLLDHAGQREDVQAAVLAEAIRLEREASEELERLVSEREHELSLLASRCDSVTPDEREAATNYIDHLGVRMDEQRRVLAELRAHTESERRALLDVSRERQSFERLRDRDAAQASEADNRREANQVDDLNMGRHIRRMSGGKEAI